MFVAKTLAAVPVIAILMSGAAQAALTADQVWEAWQSVSSGDLVKVEAATKARSGNVLTLNGVSIGPGEGPALTISDLTLTELSDGTVEIKPGAAIGATYDEGESKGSLKIVHDNLVIIASEAAAGGISYAFNADKLDVALEGSQPGYSFSEDPAEPVLMRFNSSAEGVSGTYSQTPGDLQVFDFDASAKTAQYDIMQEDPNMGGKSSSASQMVDVKSSFDLSLPSDLSAFEADPALGLRDALQKGLALSGSYSQGASTMSSSEENEFMPMQLDGTMEPSSFAFSVKKDGLRLSSDGDGGILNFASAMVPVPVQMTLGKMAFAFGMPMITEGAAEDFFVKLNLDSLAVNEEAWALVDPEGKLKHEPLIAAVDVSGKTQIDVTAAGTEVPMPESLDINAVALQIAGAALTATGAFTFDNSMGMPMPVGNADIALKGVDQLIDGLIAMGLISEDDAMGARMSIGMFMQAGSEPDSYVSKIEAKEGGSVFVNGQQVQ